MAIYSSDRSDAMDLMNKSDNESKILEICVKNFGDKKDLSDFDQGLNFIKQGKIKIAQAKYLDAKAHFNDFLKLQYSIYESLAKEYIQRAQALVEEVSVDLADFLGDEKILKNFSGANQYIDSAKLLFGQKNFQGVINPCRLAKNYVIECYKFAGKEVPEKYKVDLADFANKIYSQN
jgi:hypothetical protein